MMEVNPGFAWKKEKTRHNSPLLPDSIRGLIVGSSNCGKTTLILNLLLNPDWLDYDHLYVFGKSLHQKEYQVLRKGLEAGLSKEQLANLFKNQELIKSPIEDINEYIASGGVAKGGIQAQFFDDCKLIPDPSVLDDQKKNLIIFDDCILEKQSSAQSYYTRGRHSSCDCFYISQNYFKLDRQTIRKTVISSLYFLKIRRVSLIFTLIIVGRYLSRTFKIVTAFGVNSTTLSHSI